MCIRDRLKVLYVFSFWLVLLILSMFIGLFLRYTLILIYTAFLIVYDKCMT